MNPPESLYLDHAATTPLREEVLDAMQPYWRRHFGNAGSLHRHGREARRALERARQQVASLLSADPRDLVFTSGGTEANNLAVFGAAEPGARILTSAVEHHSVLHAAQNARKNRGARHDVVPVDSEGVVDLKAFRGLLAGQDPIALVSIMHGNNETGTLQAIDPLGEACRAGGVPFHTDAVQSAGKVPLDVRRLPVDLVSLSSHKLGGPKGVGALYVRRGLPLKPQSVGGGQERGRRAGTENVAALVGFGVACELAALEIDEENRRLRGLLEEVEMAILRQFPNWWINGSRRRRLPHILNIGIPGVEAETIMLSLDAAGVAVSTGSACTSGSVDASHVLLAMGQDHARARSGLRISLGRDTKDEDIGRLCRALAGICSSAGCPFSE